MDITSVACYNHFLDLSVGIDNISSGEYSRQYDDIYNCSHLRFCQTIYALNISLGNQSLWSLLQINEHGFQDFCSNVMEYLDLPDIQFAFLSSQFNSFLIDAEKMNSIKMHLDPMIFNNNMTYSARLFYPYCSPHTINHFIFSFILIACLTVPVSLPLIGLDVPSRLKLAQSKQKIPYQHRQKSVMIGFRV